MREKLGVEAVTVYPKPESRLLHMYERMQSQIMTDERHILTTKYIIHLVNTYTFCILRKLQYTILHYLNQK